jgi:hypothetical protein
MGMGLHLGAVCSKLRGAGSLGALVVVMVALAFGAGGCGGSSEIAPAATETFDAVTPQAGEQQAPPPLRMVPVTSDLAVGPNRFAFAVFDEDREPVRVAKIDVTYLPLSGDDREELTAEAVFRKWPTGHAGVYSVQVEFDRAGPWGMLGRFVDDEGNTVLAQTGITVQERSASPAIGQAVPPSMNRTLDRVTEVSKLTSSLSPDRDLYRLTIADAIASGMPTVVTFSTPAFCSTATCGPQVDIVSKLKSRHASRANFIHVEVYDNPDEMLTNVSNGRLSPVMDEWGLKTEPVTFVLGADGIVAGKFEGFVNEEELESALSEVLP